MTDNLTPAELEARQKRASIAREMSRLLTRPENDTVSIHDLYLRAVENLKAEEK